MSRRHAAALDFDAITIEGALLPAEWLARIAALKAPQQSTTDYGVPKGLNLRDELGRYWRIAQAHWQDFSAARTGNVDASRAAHQFLHNLLGDVFGMADFESAAEPAVIDEREYPISAVAGGGRIPLVLAPHDVTLDQRDRRFGDAGRQRSAFGLLQDYLNAEDAALWGLAGNGLTLRLARDNASLTRPAWIEADLERIFGEERFADFSLLWLLIHATRFGRPGDLPQHCALEAWRDASREEGVPARERLRTGVEAALRALGTGFVAEPGNPALRARLAAGDLSRQAYFGQLLRLVYRLIFLLTIEERGLLHPADAGPEAVKLYAEGYGLRRLRERARRRRAFDRNVDLWRGLKPVFAGLAAGQPLLALPALGGLFAPGQCTDLDAADIANAALLEAMFNLAWLRNDGHLERINWRDMGPEELGSVYESLLELEPVLSLEARSFTFAESDAARGNARKTSGSYYTPDSLVQELLDSALEPVIAQRTAGAADPEAALLAVSVCDPACGSGHFLLGAARRLATHLAQLRAQGTPTGEDFRHALRDVITHSIYGVDRNPMAIELARMSLWLEAMTPDRPLGFLDHHLQVGDALLGLADLAVLEQGIPKDAFKPLSGDDKTACRQLAARNAAELKDLARKRAARKAGQADWHAIQSQSLDAFKALEALPDATLAEIAAKQAAWQAFAAEATYSPLRLAADMWLGAFLLPKTGATQSRVPTTGTVVLELLGESTPAEHAARREAARAACNEARVLHWPLAFPLVHAAGGFACVLANPPWERIKLQEEEFFASRHADVAQARNKAERSQRIQWLSEGMLAAHLAPESGRSEAQAQAEQRLYAEFIGARREAEAASVFAHVDGKDGGRYPLTGVGDVNTYALFAETMTELVARSGRAGFIVQSGIGTDDSTKRYFQSLVNGNRLISFLGFDNAKRIFPAVHPDTPFALVTVGENSRPAQLTHYILSIDQLADPRRRFTLTPNEFRLINPNTLTCPVFRSERDAELTKKLYRAAPVLIDETRDDGNPWGISFMAMFHMSNDSHLFADAPGDARLPLYEAKLIHQFDHRWATYEGGSSREVTDAEKADPAFTITPRYWVGATEVQARLAAKEWSRGWLMGWRDITNATNERTVIASVVPLSGVGNQMPLMLFGEVRDRRHWAALLGNLCALTLDFVARHKTGGTHMNYFIYKQLPVLPPNRYTGADLAFIVPRVLELTYTAHDLNPWAEDLGFDGPPFPFDPDRRAQLRAELDATYARLYGLTRDELRYILDPADVMGDDYPSETFRVLKNNETRAFGEYRTQRLVLAAWDRLESGEIR